MIEKYYRTQEIVNVKVVHQLEKLILFTFLFVIYMILVHKCVDTLN